MEGLDDKSKRPQSANSVAGLDRLGKLFTKYLEGYGDPPDIQGAEAALYDSQLRSLILPCAVEIDSSPEGTILDIGCGNGVLLRRLVETNSFKDKASCVYIGADYEEQIEATLSLARSLKVSRRVDAVELEELYNSWLSSIDAPRPLLVVIRNVFHELKIDDTAALIHMLMSRLTSDDTMIIQDLLVFPKAERGYACWTSHNFKRVLDVCGFDSTLIDDATINGNGWFTVRAKRNNHPTIAKRDVREIVCSERTAQLQAWSGQDVLVPGGATMQPVERVRLELDLQKAALQQQLIEVEAPGIIPIDKKEEIDIALNTLKKNLGDFDINTLSGSIQIHRPDNFRDRKTPQDILEEFLRGPDSVALVHGGPFMGKSMLVAEVLSRRAHGRLPITIDVQYSSSVWNLIEQYFSGLECKLSYGILGNLKQLRFGDVKQPIMDLVEDVAGNTIVVLDHFERLLDPNRFIGDKEVQEFVVMLSSIPSAKVFLTTRYGFEPAAVLPGIGVNQDLNTLGRLPRDDYIINVLDDFVDRARFGIGDYPIDLLEAIDRHPYLAALAGRVIRKEGPQSLCDPTFLDLLRERLRDDLLRRIVSDNSRAAIDILSQVRIPIPRLMFESLAGAESVRAAEELGLVYSVYDRSGRDLLSGIGVFRNTIEETDDESAFEIPDEAEENSETSKEHSRIADWYARVYRQDDDPRWIREMHYHTFAAKDKHRVQQFGAIYKGELFAAGEYWFQRTKDFKSALWAFRKAKSLDFSAYELDLHLAACLMRTGRVPDGQREYELLLRIYPRAKGVKTSYVDSLLYIGKYEEALTQLQAYGVSTVDDHWYAYQYGRAYFGLHKYRDAVNALDISYKMKPDATTCWWLARSYHYSGHQEKVGQVLEEGLKRFKHNKFIELAYAAHLIRLGEPNKLQEAKERLEALHKRSPNSGSVLQQLCKLRCLEDDTEGAWKLVNEIDGKVVPERYLAPIKARIFIAEGRPNEALRLLKNIPNNDVHLMGLALQAYLKWSETMDDVEERKRIAKLGLSIKFDPALCNNIPIMTMVAKLAGLAENSDAYEVTLDQLDLLNERIAAEIRSENGKVSYWAEDTFES